MAAGPIGVTWAWLEEQFSVALGEILFKFPQNISQVFDIYQMIDLSCLNFVWHPHSINVT